MSVFARAMSLGAILIMLAAYTAPAKHNPQNKSVRVQKNEKVRFGGN